ncbi:HET-domain-containing protein [Plenodomus tracheiphilus IPT5]|uniref:HET-domain-containing protein n=1 Tax=Plenodomus tracheiphilus IPT5 TaxID=1408161 RepID=A0A6A7AZJ4_9PLEO|nr:HET-domain-containing protein [Plenodomus tracheiphilus IPT5]
MFCEKCSSFLELVTTAATVPKTVESCEDIQWPYHKAVHHRTLHDLKRASDQYCHLCRIIYNTPSEWERDSLLKDVFEPLDVVLYFDASNGKYPVFSVEFREAASNSVRISKRMVASCSGLLEDHELATTLKRCSISPNGSTGDEGALELAAFWTKTCVYNHGKCRPPMSANAALFLPTRLLDVSDGAIRLIETVHEIAESADKNFVALSHCWGLVPIIRTVKANYDEHRQGIAPEQLSKTFREAIHTTRKLGYRYIWIDSLCIKQDDPTDWAAEAATMCDVYQCAVLTIAAAHAPGGDVGCFAERDGLLHLPFYVELPTNPMTRVQFTSYGRTKEVGGGDPALYGRAWVLQEQILSPRMLIFDGQQIKWECLTMHGSESSPTSGTTRHSLYQKHIRSGIMDDVEYFDFGDEETAYISGARLKHQYWCYVVMDYTHRGMTMSKDRLVALAGIGKALGRHTKSEYKAGLWSDYFTIGLLWSIAHNEIFLMSAATNFDIEKNEKIRHKEDLAPSWSWASVTAPVMYASNELLSYDDICKIINVSVTDGLDKQRGRAEIRGHVRHGYVNAIYPYAIREAAKTYPHMTVVAPSGNLGLEVMNFKDRVFHPNDFFLYSEVAPTSGSKDASNQHLTTHGNFRFVRGSFRPDELIDPAQEITFIAIAQQHFSAQLETRLNSHQDDDALKVHSLALVPTGKVEGEYRRVGLAIWDECAWYGYLCGWKAVRDRIIEKPGRWTESGRYTKESRWDKMRRKFGWDDLELYEETKKGGHDHAYEADRLPDLEKYHKDVRVEERILVIV